MSKASLRIGEIARLLGVTPKTVRHYHKLELIPEPARSEGGYRLYAPADLFHLRRIRRLQSLGLSLQQIKFILDDDNPDELLRTTLEGLHSELTLQQGRIEERRQRIARYLEEGVSLVEVEQPDTPSPTYELFLQKFGNLAPFPESITEFDKQVFAQLDTFNWGEEYTAAMQTAAGYFEAHPEHEFVFGQLVQKFTALQTMAADDPQLPAWAAEMKAMGWLQNLAGNLNGLPAIEQPMADVMNHIITQNMQEHLTPAQRRFLELLVGR